jgi:hypothetical protein
MPLVKPEDFAKGDENSEFCHFCANTDGSVRTCDEIFEGGVKFFLTSLGDDRALAEKVCRKNMAGLPYWQGKDCACLKGEAATDEEFAAAMQKLG